jgi:hypothetical protein
MSCSLCWLNPGWPRVAPYSATRRRQVSRSSIVCRGRGRVRSYLRSLRSRPPTLHEQLLTAGCRPSLASFVSQSSHSRQPPQATRLASSFESSTHRGCLANYEEGAPPMRSLDQSLCRRNGEHDRPVRGDTTECEGRCVCGSCRSQNTKWPASSHPG